MEHFKPVIALLLGLCGIAGTIFGFQQYLTRGEAWLRRRVEATFDVTIRLSRGRWDIPNGGFRGFLLEWIQLLGFIACFLGWAIFVVMVILLMNVVAKL